MCEKKRLPSRLEELRLAKGYTKRQLSQELGISEAMYCRVISGQRSHPDNHIGTIAKALDADENELKALSLADKMISETSSYSEDIVDKALQIVNKNHQ